MQHVPIKIQKLPPDLPGIEVIDRKLAGSGRPAFESRLVPQSLINLTCGGIRTRFKRQAQVALYE